MNKIVFGIVIIFLFISVGFTSITGVNLEQTSYLSNAGERAWWKASECDGTTLWDCSGHNYHGTIYGADWTPGCCLDFDGVDDYVDLDNHSLALGMNKTDDITVITRFKSDGGSGMFYSISHTNPDRAYFDLQINSEGKIGVIMGDVTCTFDLFTTGSYNDGEWHLVKCEFFGHTTNPTMNLYIDGELDATTTEWLCPMLDEDFLTAKLGRDSNEESDYFNGEIDDIKVYNTNPWPPEPPCPPTIDGPAGGYPGQTLTYTFNGVDPNDDDVRFHIDWHDGNEEWTNYVPSFTDKTVTHQWNTSGDYTITAYAQDEHGWIGPSTTFTVIIPRNKVINNVFMWRLIGQIAILQKLVIFINNC